MKKTLSLLLVLAFMVLVFAGCGNQPTGTDSTAGSSAASTAAAASTVEPTAEPVVLTTVTLPTYRAGEDAGAKFFLPQVERFNQKYDGKYKIVIEESPSNTHTDRIKQLALQNKLPALFQVSDSKWVEDYLIKNGKLYNLKDWIDSKPDLKKLFVKDSLDFCTKSDGGVYALPLTVIKPTGLYYNTDMFKPSKNIADMTWDEFSTALGDNKIAYQTAEGGWTISLILTAIMASLDGGPDVLKAGVQNKVTDFNTPLWKQAFTILQNSFLKNGWSGAVGAAYPDAATSFYSKKSAILPDGTWIIDTVNDSTKWANGFDGSKAAGDYYPGNVAIANPCVYDWMIPVGLPQNELDLSLAFFEFMNTPEEVEAFILGEGGTAPNLTYSDNFKSQLASKKLLSDFASKTNANTKYVPYFSDAIAQSLFTGEFSNLLPSLYKGTSTPEKFCTELTKAAQATN